MIPDSAKTSSDVSVSILNGRKKTSKKKKASSLSSHAILPTNDIKDLFKGEKKKKRKEKEKKENIIAYFVLFSRTETQPLL